MICPHCHKQISQVEISSHLGKIRSKAKSEAARNNGKKGGRPRKPKLMSSPNNGKPVVTFDVHGFEKMIKHKPKLNPRTPKQENGKR